MKQFPNKINQQDQLLGMNKLNRQSSSIGMNKLSRLSQLLGINNMNQQDKSLHMNRIRTIFPIILHKLFNQKDFHTLLFILLLFTFGISSWAIKARAMSGQHIQEGIAKEILRFHVIANSDSEEDQKLKLLVKDTLVADIAPLVKNAAGLQEVKRIVKEHLSDIKTLAEETIQQQSFSYPVTVSLEECYFPLKIYGKYTFPPGYYQALRVKIGKAEGKNWWCVMFPPLCFVDETYSIVDEASGDKLQKLLTEEEYDTLVSSKTPVKIRFKLFDKIKELLGIE